MVEGAYIEEVCDVHSVMTEGEGTKNLTLSGHPIMTQRRKNTPGERREFVCCREERESVFVLEGVKREISMCVCGGRRERERGE